MIIWIILGWSDNCKARRCVCFVNISTIQDPCSLNHITVRNPKQCQVIYCSKTTREKTPAGSLPSPNAARKPSCCRARASFASERNDRGSVMARSLMTRRLSWTLLLERLCIRAGYFMPCSRDAAAMRVIQSVLMLRFFSFRALVA